MLFQETSINITSWRNFIPSSKINFKVKNTQKDEEKDKYVLEGVVRPMHVVIRLRCAKQC